MRISSYDGKSIKYDSAGNPIAYGDQKYVWNGKQLVEIDNPDGTKVTFAYDAQGLRTEKRQFKADGKEEYVVYYIWKDGVLTQQYLIYHMEMTVQGVTRYVDLPFFAEFLLDENNQSQGCIVNGEQAYMFVRNMQGDVIALADGEGNALVEYNYDPWGKITCTYAGASGVTDDTTLRMLTAILCPLTYRGYNYDFTTGLYYLQSRYYNPEWGRFLNCDDTSILLATQGETLGANMYAYCGNNPVNYVDPTGYELEELIYTLFTFLLLPAAIMVEKFDKLGLSYILDIDSGSCSIIADPSGVLTYNYSALAYAYSDGKYFYYQETYSFEFYYGDYNSWSRRLDEFKSENTKSSWGLAIAKKGIKGAIKSILVSAGLPGMLSSIIMKAGFYQIDKYLKEKKNFTKKSIKYLEKMARKHPDAKDAMYYALGKVYSFTSNYASGESKVYTLYKGDNCIETYL